MFTRTFVHPYNCYPRHLFTQISTITWCPMYFLLQCHPRSPDVPCTFCCSAIHDHLMSHVLSVAVPSTIAWCPMYFLLQCHPRSPDVPCTFCCSAIHDHLMSHATLLKVASGLGVRDLILSTVSKYIFYFYV